MDQQYLSYKSGYLDVSDGHSIYYECYGNPHGKPILFLHGGPGAGFADKDKRFFDPKIWNVILFDQRGSGRSKPFASLYENTTPKLVQDINKVLDLLNIDKVTLFGGSWGSTLALIYTIQNKDRVNGLILRGIYLSNSEDIHHLIHGAIKAYFPENWERFMGLVPMDKQNNVIDYYLDKMVHGTEEEKDKYAFEWSYYESALLGMQVDDKALEEDLKDGSYKSLSPIEAIYMKHHGFVPNDYILDNALLLSDLPVTIIHGRYDFICPPINAWKLHKAIKNSKLHIVFAGHSSREPEIEKKLIEEVKRFGKIDSLVR